jgi:hypothetical protein
MTAFVAWTTRPAQLFDITKHRTVPSEIESMPGGRLAMILLLAAVSAAAGTAPSMRSSIITTSCRPPTQCANAILPATLSPNAAVQAVGAVVRVRF